MNMVYKKEINMMTLNDLSEFTLYIYMYMYMSCCEFNVHTLFQRKHRDVMYLEHPEQKKWVTDDPYRTCPRNEEIFRVRFTA